MANEKEFQLKCITLKGDLADFGKHVLLPMGVTMCGLPTVDASKEQFTALKDESFSDMISEYTIEEWDITCEKCLEVFDIIKSADDSRKAKNN